MSNTVSDSKWQVKWQIRLNFKVPYSVKYLTQDNISLYKTLFRNQQIIISDSLICWSAIVNANYVYIAFFKNLVMKLQ